MRSGKGGTSAVQTARGGSGPGPSAATPYRPRILDYLGEPSLGTSNPKRPGTWILSPFVFLDTTG